MIKNKNKYGQYMTPKIVAEFMFSLADLNRAADILEPCCGEGVFLNVMQEQGYKKITAYEVDKKIINPKYKIINKSFVSDEINRKFDLIIGNPPYISWKNLEPDLKDELENNNLWHKYCNSLCDYSNIFIIKAIELLKEGGQLIFITPEYWLNKTHSLKLRNFMLESGYFEEIYHFNETPLFDNASVSTIIFKYIKTKNPKKKQISVAKYFLNRKINAEILSNLKNQIKQENTEYLKVPQFKKDQRWILAEKDIISELSRLENKCQSTIGDICDIGNGMVSGLDKAFQIDRQNLNKEELGNLLEVVKAKDLQPYFYQTKTDYIFLNKVASEKELRQKYPHFFNHLHPNKQQLNKRYQYNHQINYWDWVFLRNLALFSKREAKIFVPCKERISNKNYFRFSYVETGIFPTQDVTAIVKKNGVKENIFYILAFLNSKFVFDWLRYYGIVKGNIVEFSERPIASIPFRRIDFNKKSEAAAHDRISRFTAEYISNKNPKILEKINLEITKLF